MIPLKKVINNYILQATGLLATIAFQLYIANAFTKADYGVFSVVWSSLLIVSTVSVLGMDRHLIKRSSHVSIAKQCENYLRSIRILGLTGLVGGLLLVIYFRSQHYQWEIIISSLAIYLLHSAIKLNEGSLIAAHKVAQVNLFVSLIRPSLFLLFSYLAYLKFGKTSVSMVLLMQAMILMFVFIGTKPRLSLILHKQKIGTGRLRGLVWIKSSFPFLLIGLSLVVNQNMDILIINFYLGANDVANYSFASKIVAYSGISLGVFATIISPIVAELGIDQRKVNDTNKKFALFAFLSIMIAWLFSVYALDKFFPKYQETVPIIEAMLTTLAIKGVFGPVEVYLTMRGYSSAASKIMMFSSVINILLNLLLIPVMGIWGGVVAMIATTLFWNFLMFRHLLKYSGINVFLIQH